MGSCFSLEPANSGNSSSTAKVISLNGSLLEYFVPVKVSQVIEAENLPCFVCNSDQLYYEEHIPAMDSGDELKEGQIYFILHVNRLKYRLTASDMAALAVKASKALVDGPKKSRRGQKIRVSPVLDVNYRVQEGELDGLERFEKANFGLSRSGSVKKLQRSSSRRAKMVYRSFKAKLSTIHEGAVSV